MTHKILKDHKIIALDTMVFIYYFENSSSFVSKIEKVLKDIEDRRLNAVTTVITLSEVLVRPLMEGDVELADEYKNVINSFPNLRVLEINQYIASIAASLKAKYKIKLPDALQIAGALIGNADLFLTNDKQLKKIDEIKIVTIDQL
ncbi:MAG: Q3M7V5 PilT like protein [Candidatus Saganbacteria bacterium]|uniref:Q3M7V5 PilT like protein n=1 Tax=Candidatus Saganbacteria bacterium TaxID=2575572 RepID=A0A833KZS9_UNCSA|nr:MAG: Q3M7V5 PilT like protein [Candidatus Saganbacteria bacterium]